MQRETAKNHMQVHILLLANSSLVSAQVLIKRGAVLKLKKEVYYL